MTKEYTNSDIMRALGKLEEKADHISKTGVIERGKIYEQTARTNGRVTHLEGKMSVLDGILERFGKIESWINERKLEAKIRKQIKGEDHEEITVNQRVKNQFIKKNWFEDEFIRKLITVMIVLVTAAASYLGATQ